MNRTVFELQLNTQRESPAREWAALHTSTKRQQVTRRRAIHWLAPRAGTVPASWYGARELVWCPRAGMDWQSTAPYQLEGTLTFVPVDRDAQGHQVALNAVGPGMMCLASGAATGVIADV